MADLWLLNTLQNVSKDVNHGLILIEEAIIKEELKVAHTVLKETKRYINESLSNIEIYLGVI